MRVALDTNPLYTTQAGVARYVRGLLRGLRQLQIPELQLMELGWEVENFRFDQPKRALKTAYRELLWANIVGPRLLQKERADILHSTVSCLIRCPRDIPQVLTIHDLAFLRNPQRFRRWQRISWTAQLRRVRDVREIICISQATADEVRQLLDMPARKLHVVHNGCDFHESEPAPPESAPPVSVPSEFFLFVGSLEPGKNLALLREVYELADSRGVVLPSLVIVGARWEGVAGEGKPPANWFYLGRQSDEVLVYLYRRALALLFPSKYEGFGLPVVEAMALGCPVICSPVSSLPEVGGSAACFVPMNSAEYLQAITRMVEEPNWRGGLIEAGYAQARRFSWRRCAQETAAVYELAKPPANSKHPQIGRRGEK